MTSPCSREPTGGDSKQPIVCRELEGERLRATWWYYSTRVDTCPGADGPPGLAATLHGIGVSDMTAEGVHWIADPLTAVLAPRRVTECSATPTTGVGYGVTIRVYPRVAQDLEIAPHTLISLVPASERLHLLLFVLSRVQVQDLAGTARRRVEGAILRWLSSARVLDHLQPITNGTPTSYRLAVEKARLLIGQRLDEPLTVAEIAEHVRFSQYHFSRVFRDVTGFSVYGFVKQSRLVAAVARLLMTDGRISTIARRTGFSSHSHLTSLVTRTFGMPPSRIRKLARRDPERLLRALTTSGE